MYLSCNFKRFLGLLMLDALIFVISSAFFLSGEVFCFLLLTTARSAEFFFRS